MKTRLTQEDLAKAHSGLCGVSLGDGPCSCLVHWVEALQQEADELEAAAGASTVAEAAKRVALDLAHVVGEGHKLPEYFTLSMWRLEGAVRGLEAIKDETQEGKRLETR